MNSLTIGAQIKALRFLRGKMSQVKLAKKSGLRQDLISDFECDRAAPSQSSLQAIEAALGISFSDPKVQAAFLVLSGNNHNKEDSNGPNP